VDGVLRPHADTHLPLTPQPPGQATANDAHAPPPPAVRFSRSNNKNLISQIQIKSNHPQTNNIIYIITIQQ